MITIKEAKPRKLSGQTSLQITFKYNPAIVETIKALPFAIYHKEDFTWEVPTCYLAEVLDKLTFIDSIQLSLYSPERNSGNFELTEDELAFLNNRAYRPMKHQIEAINFMLKTGKSLLLDGCGVGKSCEMIWYAEILKRRKLIDHCLVICGICSLRGNWENEIAKFSNESSVVIGKHVTKNNTVRYTSISERAKQISEKLDEFFVILNVESIRDDAIIKAIKKSKNNFGLILFDEAHKIGAKSTSQGGNLLKLQSPYKVAATGTLITNSPISAYMPLAWTENDHATLTNYKAQYCLFGGFNNAQIIGYQNMETLRDEIESCSIRRTLYDVREDMPDMTINTEILDMDDSQRKFYDAIKEGVKEEADKIELNASNLLALTTRLRQATSCPTILTTQNIESVKINRAVELIEELISQNEKVVVLSVFKEPINQLATKLDKFRFSVNTGDIPDSEVAANVDRFQNSADEQVFLGTFGKVGTGWTLNAAAYLICIDTPYTNAMFEQGIERIHRVSNTRPAYTTVLVCGQSIDERVQQIIETKKELGEYLVDGIQNSISDKLATELKNIILNL